MFNTYDASVYYILYTGTNILFRARHIREYK